MVLGGCALLLLDLFMTWQSLQVEFPGAGTSTMLLDGWDAWGLLIAFLSLALLAVVSVVYASSVEVSDDVQWELWVLVAAAALFAVTLVKNLTDSHSAWASYVGLALAAVVLIGAALNWLAMGAPERQYSR